MSHHSPTISDEHVKAIFSNDSILEGSDGHLDLYISEWDSSGLSINGSLNDHLPSALLNTP